MGLTGPDLAVRLPAWQCLAGLSILRTPVVKVS